MASARGLPTRSFVASRKVLGAVIIMIVLLRLSRLMCGQALPDRPDSSFEAAARLCLAAVEAQPRFELRPIPGKAEPFRTSGGKAACELRVDSVTSYPESAIGHC